ncbi:MAG TPA: hypothetical protein VG389_13095 [Myxococcota bacterium]|nr:hypothetical protein [Myxococcota bacterium]
MHAAAGGRPRADLAIALAVVVAAVVPATAGAGCTSRATLAVVIPSAAVAASTTTIALSYTRKGDAAVCDAPAAATFDQTLTFSFPLAADAALPTLRAGRYVIWARALGGPVDTLVLAEQCEELRIGYFRHHVEIVLAGTGAGVDGGTDSGVAGDGGPDAGTDAGPPPVLDTLAVSVATEEAPTTALTGLSVYVADAGGDVMSATTDAAGQATFGPGAALATPLDVTVRYVVPASGLDVQVTILGVVPAAGALDVRVPSPLAPAAPASGMVSGNVVGSAGGSSATVAFVDALEGGGGGGNVNGPGTMYTAMLSDTAATYSALLHETGVVPERVALLGAVAVAPAAPDFDLGTGGVPRDVASTLSASSVPAAYDGASAFDVVAEATRGDLLVESLAPLASPAATTVFDPAAAALPAGTRLRVSARAESAATVAACGDLPALAAAAAAGTATLPAPPDFGLTLLDPPVATMPSEASPTYPAFAAGAPLAFTAPASAAPLATVLRVFFTRADTTPALLVLVAPAGATAAAVPDPAAVGATLTGDDGAGYCLTVTRVDAPGTSYDIDGGRAPGAASGRLYGGAAATSTRRLVFTR